MMFIGSLVQGEPQCDDTIAMLHVGSGQYHRVWRAYQLTYPRRLTVLQISNSLNILVIGDQCREHLR